VGVTAEILPQLTAELAPFTAFDHREGVTLSRRLRLALSAAVLSICFGPLATRSPARAEPAAKAPTPAVAPAQVVQAALSRPELPEGVQLGVSTLVPVPGDKPVLVIHAPADNQRAIIYLHGMCGNVRAVESFREAAVASGTLISLLGDRPCGGGRFHWSKKIDGIEARVENALRAVRAARGGLLDTEQPVLFGYSQGAARAESLVARQPQRYRLVVLGGSPHEPKLRHLGDATAVAVFGGELETFGHMQAGAEVLAAAGKTARFFLLPKAKHGEFGPDGNRVMSELFTWLFAGSHS
jgi:predicted esterase